LSGAERISEGTTDEDGRVAVPDGDWRYAFQFEKPLYVLRHVDSEDYPMRLITWLSKTETVVQLHHWRKRPLRMHVTANGRPVRGKELIGYASGCPDSICMACTGPEGKTDANGMIKVQEFYPESLRTVYFEDADGNRIWEADPQTWPRGVIEVDLGNRPTPTLPEPTPTPDSEYLPPSVLRPIP